jgi:acetylornithine deacetylase/succinyl-diaminopimelate desuccinylase-like protein
MASGAGHDALASAGLGVPTAMLFIRNGHGSHNPDEAVEPADSPPRWMCWRRRSTRSPPDPAY